MDHIAIMAPSWKMIDKILSGEKTVESRWSQQRRAPWNRISTGDTVYFAESGRIKASATVADVSQYEITSDRQRHQLLRDNASALAVAPEAFYTYIEKSKYVVFITLKNIKPEPNISFKKKEFGPRATWITITNINKILL